MTNGDKFKEIFPNIIKYGNILIDDTGALQKNILFDDTWWNAEYKGSTTKNDKVDCEHTDCNNCVNHKYCDYEPTTKNDLGVNLIDQAELLKNMDTWDKFGNDPNEGLIPLRTPALQDRYVPYVKYDDMVHCVEGMPSVTPQEPKTGHWIADARTYYEELKKRGLGVDEYTPYFTDDIACSECLAKYSTLDNETQFFKHCPNCGAKMVEPQESEG